MKKIHTAVTLIIIFFMVAALYICGRYENAPDRVFTGKVSAPEGEYDRRCVLRVDVRSGRFGIGIFRVAGRQDECAVHFSNQYAVALAGGSYGLFTEHRTERNKKISDVSKNTK